MFQAALSEVDILFLCFQCCFSNLVVMVEVKSLPLHSVSSSTAYLWKLQARGTETLLPHRKIQTHTPAHTGVLQGHRMHRLGAYNVLNGQNSQVAMSSCRVFAAGS